MIAQASTTLDGVLNVDLHAIAPEIALTVALLAVLVIDLFLEPRFKVFNAGIALAGIAASTIALLTLVSGDDRVTFGTMFVIDNYALLFKFLFLGVAAVTVILSITYLNDTVQRIQGEFYVLLLTTVLGMLVMPSARDMLALFVALETISIPGFVMAGFKKADERSNEAAVKFFLFGVLSSAVMLFGMSLIYGVTGSTNLNEIAEALRGNTDPIVTASVLLIVVGFAFKVSAVPFHFWAPDTYEGSPVPVAAFLSVGSKAAGFAGLLQLTFVAFTHQSTVWAPGFAILAAATMTVGNLVALSQTNLVRLLAYSSIGQSGYMLLPFGIVASQSADIQRDAFAAAMTYILIYSFMNLGAFAVAIAVGRVIPSNDIADYEGLSQREPGLALAMMVFMLSLAGMIPTAGFWAKFFVFRAAIGAGTIWLAALMVANTVVGLYYYLSVAGKMYLRDARDRTSLGVPQSIGFAVIVLLALVALVTVYPDAFNTFSPDATLVAAE